MVRSSINKLDLYVPIHLLYHVPAYPGTKPLVKENGKHKQSRTTSNKLTIKDHIFLLSTAVLFKILVYNFNVSISIMLTWL